MNDKMRKIIGICEEYEIMDVLSHVIIYNPNGHTILQSTDLSIDVTIQAYELAIKQGCGSMTVRNILIACLFYEYGKENPKIDTTVTKESPDIFKEYARIHRGYMRTGDVQKICEYLYVLENHNVLVTPERVNIVHDILRDACTLSNFDIYNLSSILCLVHINSGINQIELLNLLINNFNNKVCYTEHGQCALDVERPVVIEMLNKLIEHAKSN